MRPSHRPHEKRITHSHEIEHGTPHRLDDIGVETLIPALEIALDENNSGVGVGGDEVFGEGDGGRVGGYGAAVAEQLVPVATGEGRADGAEFGVDGGVPEGAVSDIGEELDGVIAGVAEGGEGGLHGWWWEVG